MAIPVSAQSAGSRGFLFIISFIFGQVMTVNQAIIKIVLFALLLAAFTKSLQNIFPKNPSVTIVIGGLLSLASIRLMPNIWLSGIGKLLWIAAIIVLPYLAVNLFFKEWSMAKIILLVATYLGIYFIVAGFDFYTFGFWPKLMADFRYFYDMYRFQTILVIASILAYFSLRYARKGKFR